MAVVAKKNRSMEVSHGREEEKKKNRGTSFRSEVFRARSRSRLILAPPAKNNAGFLLKWAV